MSALNEQLRYFKMVEIKINGKNTTVKNGTTLIEVARGMGYKIPSLCYLEDLEHFTSCMLCVVYDKSTGKLIPSCSSGVIEGMDIDTEGPEVVKARQRALELLLSEHVGDCEAPCRRGCPAEVNIPLVFRHFESGNSAEAVSLLRDYLPFPYTICSQCPATCEKVCRRAKKDSAVEIKDINRELSINSDSEMKLPEAEKENIAIIGAGIAGLSAAWFLRNRSYKVTVFEKSDTVADSLRAECRNEDLQIFENELKVLTDSVEVLTGKDIEITRAAELLKDYRAVIIATGKKEDIADHEAVFLCGSSNKPVKLLPGAVNSGRITADEVDTWIRGASSEYKPVFDSKITKPEESEVEHLIDSSDAFRTSGETGTGSLEEKTSRCMHCECLRQSSCSLRYYADEYSIRSIKYRADERHEIHRNTEHPDIVFEAGKCIRCGICVRLTDKKKENTGVTFKGRGYETVIASSLGRTLDTAITESLPEILRYCPTGAFSYRNEGVKK